MQCVVAELFRGHELHLEQIAGSFSVQDETSFSMAESLMEESPPPKEDTESTCQYFETYTDEAYHMGARRLLSTPHGMGRHDPWKL